jgi:putative polyketide hydroxylase
MLNNPDVLIVGGSLTGLSEAVFLSYQGVRCMVIERHAATTVQYKFAGISPRSMEIYRSVGIDEDIRQNRTGDQKSGEIARARNLADPDVTLMGRPWADTADLSSSTAETCDQESLEPILRAHAERLGADVRFHTELLDFEQDDREVSARVRNLETGQEEVIKASYLVAADGVAGTVREKLGIGRQGPGILQHWMNVIFETDLQPYLMGEKFTACFVTDINGTFTPRGSRWLMALQYQPEQGQRPEDFNEEYTAQLVRKGAGRDDVSVRLFDARKWDVMAYVADRFQEGRTFLIGDAAHVMPPTGGFGGNTGIHDAHNLAWKLAFVLRGNANGQLLESYNTERRPVTQRTSGQALSRLSAWFKDLSNHVPAPEPIVDDLAVIFGYLYQSGAVIPEEWSNEAFEDPRDPSGRPGSRAPHLMIEREGTNVGIHDLVSKGFIVLTGPVGHPWCDAAAQASRRFGMELPCICIGGSGDTIDLQGHFQSSYGVGEDGAVLIRPDGFIAWRSRDSATDPASVLDRVLTKLFLKPGKGVRIAS